MNREFLSALISASHHHLISTSLEHFFFCIFLTISFLILFSSPFICLPVVPSPRHVSRALILTQNTQSSRTLSSAEHRHKYEFEYEDHVCRGVPVLIWFISTLYVLHPVHFHSPELNNNTVGLVLGGFT